MANGEPESGIAAFRFFSITPDGVDMQTLNNDKSRLLLDLFEFQGDLQNVDPLRFRLRHEQSLGQIDSLIKSGYVREQMGRYGLSFTALEYIDSPQALELSAACESLWVELQIHYRNDTVAQVPLSQLAHEAGLEIEMVRKAMVYMIEFPWYSGYSVEFPSHQDAAIGPHEKVIQYSTFRQAVQSWTTPFQSGEGAHGLQFPLHASVLSVEEKVASAAISWYDGLPEPIATLLREVIGARAAGHRTLAAMGVRAVIDMVCTQIVGDKNTFKQKIEEIQRLGHLNGDECAAVTTAFDAGSASAHRGYLINQQNLDDLMEIMDHLLRRKYRLSQAAVNIKANTPGRLPRN